MSEWRGCQTHSVGHCWREKGPWAQERGGLWKLEKTREWVLPSASSKQRSPADTFLLAPWDPFWVSDLQNHKINLCRSKPLICGYFLQRPQKTNTESETSNPTIAILLWILFLCLWLVT